MSVQCLFLRLVLQGVSVRGVPRVLAVVAEALGWDLPIPHWTTGRLWLLRLGHALLTMALEKAEDWAWIIDHSVQIGKDKCLVILGIRLSKLPERGQCLGHRDMHLIALVPRESWTRQEVDQELEAASKRTGIPRVIVDDHGVDIAGGVSFFQERHPETVEIYDAKHKAACLLKSRLEKNPRWQEFNAKMAQARCAIQQTEMAFLVPHGPRPKARFMNLAPSLQWAGNVLAVLHDPPAVVRQHVTLERLEEKLGWLREFATEIAEWSEWQRVVNVTVEFVDRQGLYRGVAKELRTELRGHQTHPSSDAWLEKYWCLWFGKRGAPSRASVFQEARKFWNRVSAALSNWRNSKHAAASPVWCWVSEPCWPKRRQTQSRKQCNTVAPKRYLSGAAKISALPCSANASWPLPPAQQNLHESSANTFIRPPTTDT